MQALVASACLGSWLLTACAANPGGILGLDYYPAILLKEIDPVRYEKDRMSCESFVKQNATNYEPTNIVRFRQCLIDRGYKLMS